MSVEGQFQSEVEVRLHREIDELRAEVQRLRLQLQEPEDSIRAIRHGEIDALVVTEAQGDKIYTLRSADGLYRCMIENMKEAAVALDRGGIIVYCNAHFAELMSTHRNVLVGTSILPVIREDGR